MTTSPIRIDTEVLQRLEANKPRYLTTTGFLSQIVEQALDATVKMTKSSPASGGPALAQRGEDFNKEEEERVRALSLEGMPIPPTQGKPIDPELELHCALIRDFWRTKKGSKGEQAWKLLQTGLKAIQRDYGDSVVKEQLELAINGRWQSITLANYERFKPADKAKKVTFISDLTEEEREERHQKQLQEWGLV